MVLSLYGGFGVDKKTNKLLKKETKLEDSLNMTLDGQKNWTKRNGQAIKFPADTKDAVYMNADQNFTPGNPTYHNKPGRYFATTDTGYKVFNQDGSEFIPHNFSGLTNTSQMSEGEYMETLLFTHVENPQAVLKYDGGSIYRAGLPAIKFSNPAVSDTATRYGVFYDYMDALGNIVYGPLSEFKYIDSTVIDVISGDGFYEGFAYLQYTGSVINLNEANPSITFDSVSSDVKIGSKQCFRVVPSDLNTKIIGTSGEITTGLNFLSLTVTNIVGNTVTFSGFNGYGVRFFEFTLLPLNTTIEVFRRLCVRIFRSSNDIEPLTEISASSLVSPSVAIPYGSIPIVPTMSTVTMTMFFGSILRNSGNTTSVISESYDVENSKLRPPQCKYIQVFGDQVAYGSVSGLWDFENRFIKYNNDDIIMYSDASEGDYGENISEINRQLIGDTYEGNISGMCRVKDSLIVFKNKSLYAVDGELLPGEYSLRKIESNLIGCISHKSIITTEQYALFQGNDNIYVTNGFNIKEFGDDISPDIDSSKLMRSAIIVPMEGYIFWNDTKTFFYNYDHNEWFIWNNIDASSGMVIDNEGNPICFSGTNCTEFVPVLNDFGSAIDGMIQLSFLHMKKPGILKKITGVRLFNFGTTGNIGMTILKEWKDISMGTAVFDYTGNPTSIHKTINPLIGQSISIEFKNNEVDENMLISGIDVEIEFNQYKDKNVN